MKSVSWLCLFLYSFCVHSSQQSVELTGDNVTLLALKHSSPEVQKNHVLALVKNDRDSGYYSIRKDPKKLQKLLQQRHEKLIAEAQKFSDETLFTFTKKVPSNSYDLKKDQVSLKKLFLGSTKVVNRKSIDTEGLPGNFKLLIANSELQKNITIDQDEFEELPARTPVYAEVTLKLLKFQNQQNFQTVITAIKLYASEQKSNLLGQITEKREPAELIADWVLSDGITSELVGIHAFSFLGYRVQDMILDATKLDNHCKKTMRMGPHQVIVCDYPHTSNSRRIISYIGGVIAQIDLVAKGIISFDEKKQLSRLVMLQLGQPKTLFEKSHAHWDKYKVGFDFYSDAFFDNNSESARYYWKYNSKEPVKSSYTTIVSIISQDTKKLIEENT